MALLQAVTILLVALIVTPGWLFYFDVTPKAVVLLAGAAALLAAGLQPPDQARASRWFAGLLLLTAASMALSAAWSPNPALSVFGSTWRRMGVAEWIAILVFAFTVKRSVWLLRGIAAGGALTAIYGIAQYFGFDPILPAAAYHIGEGVWTIVRPPGTLGYVSYFATWLLMCGFLSLWLAGREPDARWRRAAYTSAGLSWAAMLLTGTRAAVLGLAVGAAVAGYRRGFRIPRRALAACAGLLVGMAIFYFTPAGWNLRSRTRWFVEDPWGGARPLLWRDSWRMGAHRPVAGFGPEVFTAAFPAFESKELARAYPDFAHESPHNILIDALVSQGVPGLACLAALCLLAGVSAWRRKDAWLLGALAAGVVAQQFTAFTIPTALIFYTTLALCVDEAAATPRTRARWWWLRLPVAAALLYCLVRLAAADRALAMTQQAADPRIAARRYEQYLRWKLPGASADLWYSRAMAAWSRQSTDALARLQALGEAGIAAQRATRTAEDPFDAWYNLATLYAAQNDAADTEASLRRAMACHPNWFKPHWTLARLLQMEGRIPEAAAEAAIAADLDFGKNPEVAATLAGIQVLQK